MRKAYFVITLLLLIAVVAQFYFAALGVFGPEGEDDELLGHLLGGHAVGYSVVPDRSLWVLRNQLEEVLVLAEDGHQGFGEEAMVIRDQDAHGPRIRRLRGHEQRVRVVPTLG